MNSKPVEKLHQTFEVYVETPTQQKQDALMAAAANYREYWIEARAAEKPAPQSRTSKSEPPTRYKRVYSVLGKQPDGTELTLALQSRTSARDDCTFFVVSWRTRLIPGGHNRRFYVSNDEAWSMGASAALDMLEELQRLGGLDEEYFDLDRRRDSAATVLSDVDAQARAELLEEITMPDESWGTDPIFVILGDPNEDWRKILIVNRETGRATFRSTTKDEQYMPRKTLRPRSKWFLDNSMQDANVQQARVFLEQLQKIVPSLT